jgi:hypothetical protein
MVSAGAISQTGGELVAGNLTGSARSFASISQPTNLIGTLGSFATGAGFALVNDQALVVTGPVQDSGAKSKLALTTLLGNIDVAGSLSATNAANLTAANSISETGPLTASALALTSLRGDINLGGQVTVGSTIALSAGNGIVETGMLKAGTLSGSAVNAAGLTGTNQIAVLGDFSASSFTLNDAGDLLLAGSLSAPRIAITAPHSTISLGNGATIITGGVNRPAGPIDPTLEPSNGASGAFLQGVNFTQLDSSMVLGQGGGPATLQISTTGHAQFDPPLGLQASGTWLILDLHAGNAAGNVFVGALDVSYTTPGGANLEGTIAGVSSPAAAAIGSIQPAVNSGYLFNGCIIGAPVCNPAPTPRPSTPAPAPNVGLTATLGAIYPIIGVPPAEITSPPKLTLIALPMLQSQPPQLTDPDVVPPNITFLDY